MERPIRHKVIMVIIAMMILLIIALYYVADKMQKRLDQRILDVGAIEHTPHSLPVLFRAESSGSSSLQGRAVDHNDESSFKQYS